MRIVSPDHAHVHCSQSHPLMFRIYILTRVTRRRATRSCSDHPSTPSAMHMALLPSAALFIFISLPPSPSLLYHLLLHLVLLHLHLFGSRQLTHIISSSLSCTSYSIFSSVPIDPSAPCRSFTSAPQPFSPLLSILIAQQSPLSSPSSRSPSPRPLPSHPHPTVFPPPNSLRAPNSDHVV